MRLLRSSVAVAAISGLLFAGYAGAAGAQAIGLLDYPSIHQPVVTTGGMVVSQSDIASRIGAAILAKGGNAVDATVATAFALAVVLPRAGNIGGGGFMLVHLAKTDRTLVIDYQCISPRDASLALYLDARGEIVSHMAQGYRAPGVPGTVAGLYLAQTKYGKLKWAEVVQPAVDLAVKGFVLTRDEANTLKWGHDRLQQSDEGKSVFFKKDGSFYEAGETLRQLDLGHSLAQIKTGGADAFYRGPIAREFAADMKAHGGFITADDLAAYKAVEREPLVGTYRGLKIATVPPASAGGITVLETLNVLENFDLASDGAGSAAALHLISEGLKLSAADRALIGDTDFVKVSLDVLASKAYAAKQAKRIDIHRAMATADLKPGEIAPVESPDTTQISVVDGEGNAVSNTFTLDNDFGSGVAVDGAGFLLNNGMTLFSNAAAARAQHDGLAPPANAMAPGKRMTSSISPVMVFKNGKPWLVTGSPGGNTIPGTVVQIVVDVVDFGLNVSEAGHAPRIHQGLSDVLELEPNFNPDTRALLAGLGHTLKSGETMGSVQSILMEDGLLSGAADPRRPGALAAPSNGIE